ncbi:thiamine phosphate synthase [Neobacillus sp. LXY-1]|uniref:thiamine phosphate synthase n=1 Tax=Neobacillus sp. LXY-1 TaxID=3379133 RepID=UPI003EE4146B
MKNLGDALKVYFIMGSTNCQEDPQKVLQEAIQGGITLFQFREKGDGALTGLKKYNLAKQLQEICKQNQVPFIVNDDIDLAVALNADGVHIGQDDEDVRTVREKMGDKILGVSVHSLEEAEAALKDGADYFGVGPIFPTTTKEDAKPARGTTVIQELRLMGFTTPIVGIGGITIENAHIVMEAGADGVSVISGISQASSPYKAAMDLKNKVFGVVTP